MNNLQLTLLFLFLAIRSLDQSVIDKNNYGFPDGFVYIPDDQGNLHYVNLTLPTDVVVNVTLDDFNVYFYSPTNQNEGRRLSASSFNGSVGEGFDPSLKSVFSVHGWNSTNTSESCIKIRLAMQQHGGVNIFVIDYTRISNEAYPIAVLSLPKLGEICGNFLDTMLDFYNFDASRISLVAVSLGAHLAGHCSRNMRKIPGQIAGLDPAGPLFIPGARENCLGPEDADVVHVTHTNKGGLGIAASIGHADFYANGGGPVQPGCEEDVYGFCSHRRAADYYSESINSVIGFKSRQCNSYELYEMGFCNNNPMTYAGGIDLDKNASGNYYFDTNAVSPFAIPSC